MTIDIPWSRLGDLDPAARRRIGMLVGVALTCAWFAVLHRFGFGQMVRATESIPERLRDFTFPVWDSSAPWDHGFLVFLEDGDFEQGASYSNHSTAYLLLMYGLYQVDKLIPGADLRLTANMLWMALTVGAAVLLVRSRGRDLHDVRRLVLLTLGIAFLASVPGYWISAGQFNVDNPFHFYVPLLIACASVFAYRAEADRTAWLVTIGLAVASPTAAVLLALVLAVRFVHDRDLRDRWGRVTLVMFLVALVVAAQPVLTSVALGFESDNSGWLFRAGLDGDRTYFSNLVESVAHPFADRPVQLLIVPVLVLLLQLVMMRWRDGGSARLDSSDRLLLQLLFSNYLVSLVLWPQAVSVHPYLYDHLLLVPVLIWIILNFARSRAAMRYFDGWVWLMFALLMLNLTQIAQAGTCPDCGYPPWPTPWS